MLRTLEQISAEQNTARQDQEKRLAERRHQEQANAEYEAAWGQFVRACYLEWSDKAAGQAVAKLAHLIVERGKLPRLQEVAEAFAGRPNEAYAAGVLLEAISGKASPSKLGKSLNAAKEEWGADPSALSDASDTLRGAVRADRFAPPPAPTPAKPARVGPSKSEVPTPEAPEETRQSDIGSDTPKKTPLKMTKEAATCADLYRKAKRSDPDTSMKDVVSDYTKENGGSKTYIMRVLNDNPDQWKTPARQAAKKR
jgi:hypothetical protein